MSTQRPINLERLDLATDAQLAEAHAAALHRAHDAPKELAGDPPIINGNLTWAMRSREAFRIGNEIARRQRKRYECGRDDCWEARRCLHEGPNGFCWENRH